MTDPWHNRIVATANVAPAELTPHRFNFRVHPDRQAAALGGVLDEIGLIGHVLVNRTTGHIIDGHLRRDLALERGQATIPVAYVELTPDEEALALATFDAVGALATTDAAKLDQVLADVQTDNAAINALLDELRGEVLPEPGLGGDEFDAGPLDQIEPRCATGELWLIDGGRHRLLIGDATSAEDVGRLMDGERAGAVVTDPPYGTGISAPGGLGNSTIPMQLHGDTDSSLARAAYKVWQSAAPIQVWWGAQYYADSLPPSSGWIVWDKDHHGMTFGDAELAWTNVPGAVRVFRHAWSGMHRASEREVDRAHPTQKPVALMEWSFDRVNVGAVVVDPFLGSGTTIIAAHRTGRRCYGLEISEQYGEVILRRCEAEHMTVELSERVRQHVDV